MIGTIYKEMKMKPNILDEYTKARLYAGALLYGSPTLAEAHCDLPCAQDRGIDRLIGRTKFAEADDAVVIEDDGARALLRGHSIEHIIGSLVTGVVLAVRGCAAPGGDHFQVSVRHQRPHCASGCAAAVLVPRLPTFLSTHMLACCRVRVRA